MNSSIKNKKSKKPFKRKKKELECVDIHGVDPKTLFFIIESQKRIIKKLRKKGQHQFNLLTKTGSKRLNRLIITEMLSVEKDFPKLKIVDAIKNVNREDLGCIISPMSWDDPDKKINKK